MTVYRQHLDTRDGKIYNCVQMPDGRWWSEENLAWDGAGRYYSDDPANGPIYGKLYSWAEANANCPPGSHLPIQSDFLALNVFPGGDLRSVDWGGSNASGFAALPAGYYFALTDTFYSIGSRAIWWCQGGFAAQMYADSGVQPSTEDPENRASVRFIVDVFNEPTPSPYDFQPPPGTYTSPQSVSLNKSGFVYTTDGSDPNDDSKPFISPIRISGPTEIKVKRLSSPEIFTFPYIVKDKPMEQYKQRASMQAGAASMEFITRTQTL